MFLLKQMKNDWQDFSLIDEDFTHAIAKKKIE